MEKLHLNRVVVTEGKYDKITLENVLDAPILTTEGFGIFQNAEKRQLLKTLARDPGLLILTDSDGAGRVIRNHLKNICADGDIRHAYIPRLLGKESRKKAPGKEGILGVEGLSPEILLKALADCGITPEERPAPDSRPKRTKTDLYRAGLTGTPDAAGRRERYALERGWPGTLSTNALLELINVTGAPLPGDPDKTE